MRDVLVVLFWLWVVVSLSVYGLRLYRRFTREKVAEGAATSADGAGAGADDPKPAAGGLGRFGRRPDPPLPEGPLEARLPKSLQGPGAPGLDGAPLSPAGSTPSSTGDPSSAPAPGGPPSAPAALPTVAEALTGIALPDGLLPHVEAGDAEVAGGQVARFAAPGASVSDVAAQLGAELERLGYAVEGADAVTADGARLRATRETTVVTGTVTEDEGRVVVELRV